MPAGFSPSTTSDPRHHPDASALANLDSPDNCRRRSICRRNLQSVSSLPQVCRTLSFFSFDLSDARSRCPARALTCGVLCDCSAAVASRAQRAEELGRAAVPVLRSARRARAIPLSRPHVLGAGSDTRVAELI
eukprot:2488213-Rhodomonas_salina.2